MLHHPFQCKDIQFRSVDDERFQAQMVLELQPWSQFNDWIGPVRESWRWSSLLTRTEGVACALLYRHALAEGSPVERSRVCASARAFLHAATAADVTGRPVRPRRPASVHWMKGWTDKPDNILCLTMYFLSWTPAPLTAGFTQRSRWTVKKKKRCLSKDDQWCLPLHWSLTPPPLIYRLK